MYIYVCIFVLVVCITRIIYVYMLLTYASVPPFRHLTAFIKIPSSSSSSAATSPNGLNIKYK